MQEPHHHHHHHHHNHSSNHHTVTTPTDQTRPDQTTQRSLNSNDQSYCIENPNDRLKKAVHFIQYNSFE